MAGELARWAGQDPPGQLGTAGEADQRVGLNFAKLDNFARVIGRTTDALRKANESDQALINAIRAELPTPAGSNDSRPS